MEEYEIYLRADAGLNLMSEIIKRTKVMLEQSFGSTPTSYHEGERRQVLDVARDIYKLVVTPEAIEQIVKELPRPEFETITPRFEQLNNDKPREANEKLIKEEWTGEE